MLGRAFWLGLVALGCGGSPPPTGRPTAADPRMPPSDTVARVSQRLGAAPQACGESVQGIDHDGCRAQPVLDCVYAAFREHRPAHGTSMYATAEGDPVRVDYFVLSVSGKTRLVLVTDRTADPVGAKSVDGHECADVRWGEHRERTGCQTLVPERCALRSRVPRARPR